jgi:hypothetical protein
MCMNACAYTRAHVCMRVYVHKSLCVCLCTCLHVSAQILDAGAPHTVENAIGKEDGLLCDKAHVLPQPRGVQLPKIPVAHRNRPLAHPNPPTSIHTQSGTHAHTHPYEYMPTCIPPYRPTHRQAGTHRHRHLWRRGLWLYGIVVVEAEEELKEGALAAAGRAHHSHALARTHGERDRVQAWRCAAACRVSKAHIL